MPFWRHSLFLRICVPDPQTSSAWAAVSGLVAGYQEFLQTMNALWLGVLGSWDPGILDAVSVYGKDMGSFSAIHGKIAISSR